MARLSFVVTAIAALVATAWCADPALPVKLQKNHFFKGKITYTVTASCEIADADKASYLVDAAGAFKAEVGAVADTKYPITLTPCTGTAVQLQQVAAETDSIKILTASLEKKLALISYIVQEGDPAENKNKLALVREADIVVLEDTTDTQVTAGSLVVDGERVIAFYNLAAGTRIITVKADKSLIKNNAGAIVFPGKTGVTYTTNDGDNTITHLVSYTSNIFTADGIAIADATEQAVVVTPVIDNSMLGTYKTIAAQFNGKIQPAEPVAEAALKVTAGSFYVDQLSCDSADLVKDTDAKGYSAVCSDSTAKAYAMYQFAVAGETAALAAAAGQFVMALTGAKAAAIVTGDAPVPQVFMADSVEAKSKVAMGSFKLEAAELVAPELASTISIKSSGVATDVSDLITKSGVQLSQVIYNKEKYYAIKPVVDDAPAAECTLPVKMKYSLYTLGEATPKEAKVCASMIIGATTEVVYFGVKDATDAKKLTVKSIAYGGAEAELGSVADFDATFDAGTPAGVFAEQGFFLLSGADSKIALVHYKNKFTKVFTASSLQAYTETIAVQNVDVAAKKVTAYYLKPAADFFNKKDAALPEAEAIVTNLEYMMAVSAFFTYAQEAVEKKAIALTFKDAGVTHELTTVSHTTVGQKQISSTAVVPVKNGEKTTYHAYAQEVDSKTGTFQFDELTFAFDALKADTAITDVVIASAPGACSMRYKQADKSFIQPCGSATSGGDGLSAGAIAGIVIAVVVVVVAVVLVLYFLVFKKK